MLVVDWNWRSFLRPGYLTPEYSKKPFTQSWLLIGESLFERFGCRFTSAGHVLELERRSLKAGRLTSAND